MKIEIYRGAPFVDREEDIEFLIDWFAEPPQRILWIYGPKSSGKTTLIEYVIGRINGTNYWIKYFNLREALISSYGSFLDTFFGFSAEIYQKIKRKQINLFKAFIEKIHEIKRTGKTPILIIDEIQKLRDVYVRNNNGERELLKEFLNFCVRLTKETHLCHVVILTSNTVFIEKIYNDAKMKATSDFKKVDHLKKV